MINFPRILGLAISMAFASFSPLVMAEMIHNGPVQTVATNLPSNFELNFWFQGTEFDDGLPGYVTSAAGSDTSALSSLATTGPTQLRWVLLGESADWKDTAVELTFGQIFSNKTSAIGDVVTTEWAGGILDFNFCTDGGLGYVLGCINNNGVATGYSDNLYISISAIIDQRHAVFFFDDGYGDGDFGDLVVGVSMVPLPSALPLMIVSLGALGLVSARRRHS